MIESAPSPEVRIHTKAEVVALIGRYAEAGIVTGERSDELGLAFLEVQQKGSEEGHIISYIYYRAKPGDAKRSSIMRVEMLNGEYVTGHTFLEYDEAKGVWYKPGAEAPKAAGK